eukprot:SAG11_NODE_216_length_12231_cov_10.404385_2_plen_104_part_00
MAADKVRALIDMPLPNESQTQIRGFLGIMMAGFYKKFISAFAEISRPLNALLKKGVNVAKSWTQEHSDAVAKIKQAMITYLVLRQYDPKRNTSTSTATPMPHT